MSNAVSEDFPFQVKYGNVSKHPKPRIVQQRDCKTNFYNNESPDFFRISSMKEDPHGYHNPYLDEVLKVDRSEEFKKLDFVQQQIRLIDQIKSRREYSQNPKILRYIRSDFDISMQEKRERNQKESSKFNESAKYCLTSTKPEDLKMYNDTLKKLVHISPKMSYKLKETLDLSNVEKIGNEGIAVTDYDKKNLETLKCPIEPRKSGYLCNLNDYHISEADKFDPSSCFTFNRKPHVRYNPLKDMVESEKLPPVINQKWDSFSQNFLMLMGKEIGFQKKGGLFSEFSNKNIGVIEVNKRNHLEQMKQDAAKSVRGSRQGGLTSSTEGNISRTQTKTSKKGRNGVTFDSSLDKAKKVMEENNLFKLQNAYTNSSVNRAKENLPVTRY